ncbi:hypothetical protein [Legionella sp. km772]|uniref:hypothetical protein n=1 Tax=Legionella sp. km772 TaxID=2498111 RepID=UPI000F8C4259|nr:hypothetical protein [Legionella sp. km772]RUR11343.1 hypothetical protein ELY15_07185 [Legionella sp. km772]
MNELSSIARKCKLGHFSLIAIDSQVPQKINALKTLEMKAISPWIGGFALFATAVFGAFAKAGTEHWIQQDHE